MDNFKRFKSELEKMIVKYNQEREEEEFPKDLEMYWKGFNVCMKEINSIISNIDKNTPGVKELDLEKEIGKYLDVNNIESGDQVKLFDFARYFFELGLRV